MNFYHPHQSIINNGFRLLDSGGLQMLPQTARSYTHQYGTPCESMMIYRHRAPVINSTINQVQNNTLDSKSPSSIHNSVQTTNLKAEKEKDQTYPYQALHGQYLTDFNAQGCYRRVSHWTAPTTKVWRHNSNHPTYRNPKVLPLLNSVTYVQSEILPTAKTKDKKEKSIMKKSQQNTEQSLSSSPPTSGLTEETLNKILSMPAELQSRMMKLLEQQNEIQILELKLKLKSESDHSGKINSQINPPLTNRTESQRTKSSSPQKIRQKPTQKYQQSQSPNPSESRESRGSINQESLSTQSDRRSLSRPRKLSITKLLGLKGKEPITIEEIKAINAENLMLTSNSHLSESMSQGPKTKEKGLQFSDEEGVKRTLMAMNPEWTGSPDELMRAMKAHLSGQQVTFSDKEATIDRHVDEAFKNVCHIQTHNLLIEYLNDTTGQYNSREVPMVQIYSDPPVAVMSDFLSSSECQEILSMTGGHWASIDEQQSNGVPPVNKGVAKLPRGQSDLIDRLIRRAAAACQVSVDEIEDMYILRYKSGEGSDEHLEPLYRRSTLLVYLNRTSRGGRGEHKRLMSDSY